MTVTARLVRPVVQGFDRTGTLAEAVPGTYRAEFDLAALGNWRLEVGATRPALRARPAEHWRMERELSDRVVATPEFTPPPASAAPADDTLAAYVARAADGTATLHLMIENLHCAGCVHRDRDGAGRASGRRRGTGQPDREAAPPALDGWRSPQRTSSRGCAALGHRAVPFDPDEIANARTAEEKRAAALPRRRGFRRRQRHAAVGRRLGRRSRRHDARDARPDALALGADRAPGDCLGGPALLRFGGGVAARARAQHGRADRARPRAGRGDEPVRDRARRRRTPISTPPSRCCSSCWSGATSTRARAARPAPPPSASPSSAPWPRG